MKCPKCGTELPDDAKICTNCGKNLSGEVLTSDRISKEEWKTFEDKLKSQPSSARNFVRFFFAGAAECEIDKQGRFLIPTNLRTAANLEKDAIIIGVGTRLEIWNKETWEKCDEEISADEIAENMANLGI